ncbi:LysR family transcriptional regulator [Rhodopseudomonas sp. B29]|uniref:LysR family transcriptional regulator n=1 Tax=Rhodopseudomonas sp. B29 TaxID=95607 RepID=UPI00034903AB|nr:LysR family transcriptional regulator [Rhodopseudomonas sp. B29]
MDRLDCLRAFVKVMEGGSFSSAARDLGLGQPAVSKRIAVLEREFGTQLFMRNTRKLTPTREAHRIYDLARQALSCIETARASVAEAPAGPTGTLRLGVPTSFGRHYIMPVIEQYLRAYPDVKVDVRFSERNVDLVEDGIELALRIGRLESSSLKARRIGTVRRFLVATPTYLRRHPLPQLPGDLKNLSCIGYARLSPAGQWAFESELGRHVVEIAGSLVVDDADAMKQAVLQHLGVAILPAWCATEAIRRGEMEVVLPEFTVPALPLHAVYPDTQWMSLRARCFLDLVVVSANLLAEDAARLPA